MASIPEPVAQQSVQLPDAVNAAPPGHLLRALEWRTGLEYLAALGAARDSARSGHVHGPRSEGVFFFRSRRLLELGLLRSATGILVTALPIFAVGQKAPPESAS